MKGSRPVPIIETHVPTSVGRIPERDELRAFLLQYSQHRFGPVGAENVIISCDGFNTFRPDNWARAEYLAKEYGYTGKMRDMWEQLVRDVTGRPVATQGQSLKAGFYWNAKMDEPVEYTPYREEERHGLPVFQVWRDVREWCPRQGKYLSVARQSAWCVR